MCYLLNLLYILLLLFEHEIPINTSETKMLIEEYPQTQSDYWNTTTKPFDNIRMSYQNSTPIKITNAGKIHSQTEKQKRKRSEESDFTSDNYTDNDTLLIDKSITRELFRLLRKLNLSIGNKNADKSSQLMADEDVVSKPGQTANELLTEKSVESSSIQINKATYTNYYYQDETASEATDLEYDDGSKEVQFRVNEPEYVLETESNEIHEGYSTVSTLLSSQSLSTDGKSTDKQTKTKPTTTKTVKTTHSETTTGRSIERTTKKPTELIKDVPYETLPPEDEVVLIRRVRGIWLGGKCRCNYYFRSHSCHQFEKNLSFMYYFLICLYYII